jgi:hypothetical protein
MTGRLSRHPPSLSAFERTNLRHPIAHFILRLTLVVVFTQHTWCQLLKQFTQVASLIQFIITLGEKRGGCSFVFLVDRITASSTLGRSVTNACKAARRGVDFEDIG